MSERAVIEFALSGLRGLLISHGGAMIALLTFLGNSSIAVQKAGYLWTAFGLFASGLFLTLVSLIFSYFSQAYVSQNSLAVAERLFFHDLGNESLVAEQTISEEKAGKISTRMRITAIIAASLSALGFIGGIAFGIWALVQP